MTSLLDSIRELKAKKAILIHENDLHEELQKIADLLPKGEAFVHGGEIFLPAETARQLLNLNQLYAKNLISQIKEIQPKAADQEVTLINELFSLLPSKISLVIINNQKYHNLGNKKAGEILTEEEILSHIIDD